MRTALLFVLAVVMTPAAMADDALHPYLGYIQEKAASIRAGDTAPESLDAWQEQRQAIRAGLLKAWGGFPEDDAPLNPQVLEVLPRDGYRVEKIIFQTLPDVWITANAYVPDQPGPRPAVLSVHGHWPGAKQDPHVQARCIGLAKLGYFVLAVDAFGAGERGVGEALGEYHGDMTAATLWPIGRPLSGIQVYENQRAVDYLLTRPEVDGTRLGITGASGGGNQSMYAGAWDERFKAVVPVCSVGNYQAYLGAACCMCEVVPGVLSFTEEWGVLSLVAPRALMVVNATEDARQFSVGEAKKSLALAAPVFGLYDKPDHLRHAVFESGHDYNQPMREAMYGWMALHLKEEGDGSPIPEPAMTLEEAETLRCFPGDTRPDDWTTLPMFAAAEGRKLVERIAAPASPDAWEPQAQSMRERLAHDVLDETGSDAGRPASDVPAPAAGTIVVLRLSETESPEEMAFIQELTDAGKTVLPLPLRATGASAYPGDAIGRAPDHNTAEWALWTGQPLLGQWVADVRSALDAWTASGGIPDELGVVGFGPAGVVALAAAALDERIDRVACVGTLASYISDVPYEGQRLGIMAPGILRDLGDIPQLAALVAPRKLVIAGGVNGAGTNLDESALTANYQFAQQIYALMNSDESLSIQSVMSAAGLLAAWE